MLEKVVQACRYLLCNYPGAEPVREYLNSRLKIDTQEKFQFGYYPGMNELHLLINLVGEDILLKYKLMYHKNIEDALSPRIVNFSHFENYPLIMPFTDTYGQVVGLVGRTLLSSDEMNKRKISKYKNTAEFKKGNYLFGLYQNKHSIIEQGSVYIVEGQFDVMKAMEHNINNIVAIGNNNLSLYQFSVISRYTNNIIMLLDNDDAGVKGRQSTLNKFGKFANLQNFYLPEGYKDIDEYFTCCPNEESPSFVIKG